jgi:hypothetical protein
MAQQVSADVVAEYARFNTRIPEAIQALHSQPSRIQIDSAHAAWQSLFDLSRNPGDETGDALISGLLSCINKDPCLARDLVNSYCRYLSKTGSGEPTDAVPHQIWQDFAVQQLVELAQLVERLPEEAVVGEVRRFTVERIHAKRLDVQLLSPVLVPVFWVLVRL